MEEEPEGADQAPCRGIQEELQEAAEVLQLWSVEGPPRNPRASAAALLSQVQAAAPAAAALEAEAAELRQRVGELEQQAGLFRQEAQDSQRHAKELEARLRAEAAAERRREAEARGAAEAAAERRYAAVEAELVGARALQAEREALAGEDLAAGARRAAESRAEGAALRRRLEEREARLGALEAELSQLRTQNLALCAQVREGMPPVTVMCRIRPMESYGSLDPALLKSALAVDVNEISLEDNSSRPRKFRVGRVLDGCASQDDVFAAVAPLVETVTCGGSACIFAYGATGSGKTYTLQGAERSGAAPGLAHHALRRLVEGPGGGPVRLSMVEVYCEQIRDLLTSAPADASAPPPSLQCSRRDAQGRMALDCARSEVGTFAEAEELLARGYAARAAGGTLCNERSSRSHVVLFATCLSMEGNTPANGGQLVLVDLAGSENVQKSGADEDSKLLAEAKAINKSLSALADVVEATSKRQQFVPYRNSRLTMLLEEALTQAKVLVMVHVSPLARDATDSGHSLNFAGRVQAVDFGAQRMRAEQEERLKSGLQRLRKEKEAAENRESELRRQNSALLEQLHSRAKDPPSLASTTIPSRAEEAAVVAGTVPALAPAPVLRSSASAPGLRRVGGRASPEPRSVAGRVPTPDPRLGATRGRGAAPAAEPEAPARQRVPTPMPSRRACEALLAATEADAGGSDAEEAEEPAPRASGGGRREGGPGAGAAARGRAGGGGEEGTARVLCDITNLPVGGSGTQEGKDIQATKLLLSPRACHQSICQTPERRLSPFLPKPRDGVEQDRVWVDQHLQGAEDSAAEGDEAPDLKPALKREKTNFALKMKQRRLHLSEATPPDEEAVVASTPSKTRHVHFDDQAPAAKSPPKWYLSLLASERQEARTREEEAGISPGGRPQRTERPSRRPREAKPVTEPQDSSSEAPPRWRR